MLIGKKKHGIIKSKKIFQKFFVLYSWIRFEEIAETVLGRWSKPHVATLMQMALLDLKTLLQNGILLLDLPSNELSTISCKIFE